MKVGPLPEGKVAEPLEEGPKAKGRPASSAAGRRKKGAGYVGLGSDSSSTQPSPSPSASSSVPPLRKGTPATPKEGGSLGKGDGKKGKPLQEGTCNPSPSPCKKGRRKSPKSCAWTGTMSSKSRWDGKMLCQTCTSKSFGTCNKKARKSTSSATVDVESWAKSLPLSGAASGASGRGVAHGARLPGPSGWDVLC